MSDADLRYATFWDRLRAGLVDFIVFLPMLPLTFWAMDAGRREAAVVYVATSAAYYAYAIVGHAVFGQTLGKRAVGIRVADLAGSPIGWRRATLRSSVDILLGALSGIGYLITLWHISDAEFVSLDVAATQARHDALRPWWAAGAEYLYYAWLASEVASVLFNRRRRALHDFVAGTVVIRDPRAASGVLQTFPGQRPLVWANRIVAVTAFALAAIMYVGGAAMPPSEEPVARTGAYMTAGAAALLSAAFGAAAHAMGRGSRRRWLWQALAIALVLLVALPFVWAE